MILASDPDNHGSELPLVGVVLSARIWVKECGLGFHSHMDP